MNVTTRTPVLFISHGAPTFALEPGQLGPQLRALGSHLPELKAVLVVSPHWQTQGVKVMTTALPDTIHDFGGFAANLYTLHYAAAGAPEMAHEAARLLREAVFAPELVVFLVIHHGA